MADGELKAEEIKLTDSQRARIERNRQRALLLRQSRLISHPYLAKNPEDSVIRVEGTKLIDSGGGFFIEESEKNVEKAELPVVQPPAPTLTIPPLLCNDCGKEFNDSFLLTHFDENVCEKCRDPEEKHALITKTESKNLFLLKDHDFDQRGPPLKCIVKKNPHNNAWGDMHLYLKLQVEMRAMEVWGSEQLLEEEKERRNANKERLKQKKFDKKVKVIHKEINCKSRLRDKPPVFPIPYGLDSIQDLQIYFNKYIWFVELRRAVRSSLYKNTTSNHEHEFGEESYDEAEDMYSKTCSSCGHVVTYEKM